MGSAASIVTSTELEKPTDASDITAENAVAEVQRLRQLLSDASPPNRTSYLSTEEVLSASEILRRIHTKEKSCVDIVKKSLQRIEETAACRIVVDLLREDALAAAKAVDEKIANGGELRVLEGLPIVVKTNIDGPSGSLTTASTPAFADWRPQLSSPVVDALLKAGAIVVGKVNMCEMAVGMNAKSPVHGRCLNPHHIEYNAGASSSGTAAAVAAGIVSVGLGSDTAGSLRAPAMCCGVVGMRPSQGRWPSEGMSPPPSFSSFSLFLLYHCCLIPEYIYHNLPSNVF